MFFSDWEILIYVFLTRFYQESGVAAMNQNISNFLLCGSAGWCMEIFWTGLHSLFTGQKTLTGKTSLLMFPIYGCACYCSTVRKIIFLPILLPWNPVYCRILSCGIHQWKLPEAVRNVSLGLQRCTIAMSWCHPSGLCATVVYCRTDFRKNSDRPSLIFYYEYGKIILKNQFY